MKEKGSALVELVLCLELGALLLFGSAFLRHLFRARAASLTLVAAGSQLAAHPELSDDDRSRLLTEAGRRIFPCPFCQIEMKSERYLDSPASHFYTFLQTRATVHFGHARLRSLLGVPESIQESAVVSREPSHDL